MEFMNSTTNWKTLSVGNVGNYGVRLIGIGQDELYDPNEKINHPLFTFEFNECLNITSYSYEQGGAPFYTKAGSEDPNEKRDCLLRTYSNNDLFSQLPSFLQKRIRSVKKRTLQINEGIKCKSTGKPYYCWTFDEGCLDGTYKDEDGKLHENNKLSMVETKEELFSLSLDEIGGAYLEFDTGVTEDWETLVNETAQANTNYLSIYDPTGSVGEGFERTKDRKGDPLAKPDHREAYMFYQKEWDDAETKERPYKKKREKQYFIGDDPQGIQAQYRLRSIYIPHKKDKDDLTHGNVGGNKDYRGFETFNVNTNGSIGNVKHSDIEEEANTPTTYNFLCGDMAWAGIYIAPAFCL